jgi:branched-chain amino acid transport system ATP-binding protein
VAAVKGISFEVNEGEVVSLVGPNGAGKTTTLHAIAGVLRLSSGSVTFDGKSTRGESPEDLVRRGLSLVPEGRHIFTSLTVRENLLLGATPHHRDAGVPADIERVETLFPILSRQRDAPAGQLSGGQQQQLAIARALLSRPRLLLLDEPSLGLAPQVVDEVFEVLEELRADGVTMLLVEQSAVRAIEFADRSHVLSTGKLVLSGTGDDLLQGDELTSAYFGFEGVPR